jgi:hypothetical protein
MIFMSELVIEQALYHGQDAGSYRFLARSPDCGAILPKFRMPASGRQALWGGWICPECGCAVDRKGNRRWSGTRRRVRRRPKRELGEDDDRPG